MSAAIRILRGAVQIGKTLHLPDAVVVVEDELLEFLKERICPTLDFELVEAAEAVVSTVVSAAVDVVRDALTSDDDVTRPAGPMVVTGSAADHEEGGEVVPVPSTDTPSSPAVFSLSSIDSRVSEGLIAIGIDTLEKLKAATVEQLIQVKGIGKARAEAILAEAAGA